MTKDRIGALAARITNDFMYADFSGKLESQVILIQTIDSCAKNVTRRGEPFSFKGTGLTESSNGGLVDNPAGLRHLIDKGWIVEERRPDLTADDGVVHEDGAPVVLKLTEALLDDLESYLAEA